MQKKKGNRGVKIKDSGEKIVRLRAEVGTEFAEVISLIQSEGVATTLVKQTVMARYGAFIGDPNRPKDRSKAYRAYWDLIAWANAIADYYELPRANGSELEPVSKLGLKTAKTEKKLKTEQKQPVVAPRVNLAIADDLI